MIPGVPYDAEIEYLKSTGTQWIDLGIYGTGNMEAEVTYKAVPNNKTGSSRVFGARETKDSRAFFVAAFASGKNTSGGYIYWNYGQQSSTGLNLMLADFNKHTVSVGHEVKADGNLLKTFTKETFTTPYTLKLFTAEYSSGFGDLKFVGYIYDFKLFDGDGLILDFIPVRVGQTGYMYDRVTKRLFGNKGTGSFVLGPDVAKPVIGLYGMRKFYNARDYVQDGLVAMWDGIENAGWGKHDSERRLVDLCGDASLTMFAKADSSLVIFGDNYVQISDNYNSSSYPITTNGTVSLVGKCSHSELCITNFNGYGNTTYLAPYELGANNRVDFSYGVYRISAGTSSDSASSFRYLTSAQADGTYSFAYEDKTLAKCIGIYKDGVNIVNSTRNIFAPGYGGGVGKIGCFNYYSSAHGIARRIKFHNLRFYNRALSPAEIAHNYAIDKARFNLP